MHRSNFRSVSRVKMPEVFSAGEAATEKRVDAKITDEFATISAKLDIFNRRIEGLLRFVDHALTEHSNSMHANMTKSIGGAHAAINSSSAALDMRISDSNGKLSTILTSLASELAGTKRELDEFTSRLNAINDGVRGELEDVKKAISAVHNAVANVTGTVTKLAKPKKEKMAESAILSKLDALSAQVDNMAGLEDDTKEEDKSSALSEVMSYVKAKKQVIRDSEGFITGWEVK